MKKLECFNNIFMIIFILSSFLFYINDNIKYIYYIVNLLILLYLFIIKRKSYSIVYDRLLRNFGILLISLFNVSAILNIGNKSAISQMFNIIVLIIILNRIVTVYGKEYIDKIFYIFIIFMLIINIFGLYEYITNINLFKEFSLPEYQKWGWPPGNPNYRITSFFIHPIVYGNILNINLIGLVYLRNSISKKFFHINVILIFICIYATKSRSCWISLGLILLIYFSKNIYRLNKLKLTKRKIISFYLLIMILILGVLIFNSYIKDIIENVIFRFTYNFSNDISKVQRLGTIKLILMSSFSNIIFILFGHGLATVSNFMINNVVAISGFTTTDNQYMTFIYEMGYIFFIVFIMYLLRVLYNIFNSNNELQVCSSLILISICSNMFFYEAFGWKNILIWIMFSIILSSIKGIYKFNKGDNNE